MMDNEANFENQGQNLEKKSSETNVKSPYCNALQKEIITLYPDKKELFTRAFDEISSQILENFSVFEAGDVSVPFSKISVTPEVVRKIIGADTSQSLNNSQEINNDSEKRLTFCFTAFQQVNNPMAVEDMGIDEFFRNLNRVAQATKKGEPTPETDIYLLDLPTAYGGKITPEWLDNMKQNGISEYGKLFSSFIKSRLPNTPEAYQDYVKNLNIRLHGVSMDSLADQTFLQLPQELQLKTQRLLDNPAGNHNPANIFKGIQAGAGVIGEGLFRNFFDNTARELGKARQPFIDYLRDVKKIGQEDSEQTKLKNAAFIATALKLFKGTPLHLGSKEGKAFDEDPNNRGSFIRRGFRDPLTTGPLNIARALLRKGKMIPEQRGKSLEFTVNKSHIFFYQNFDRWAKNLDFIKSTLSS